MILFFNILAGVTLAWVAFVAAYVWWARRRGFVAEWKTWPIVSAAVSAVWLISQAVQ